MSARNTQRIAALVSALAERLKVRSEVDEEIEGLKQDMEVAAVLDKIESADEPEDESSQEDAPSRR